MKKFLLSLVLITNFCFSNPNEEKIQSKQEATAKVYAKKALKVSVAATQVIGGSALVKIGIDGILNRYNHLISRSTRKRVIPSPYWDFALHGTVTLFGVAGIGFGYKNFKAL